jgi:AraC-like DNA-binding protein/quercetin dioxygenase-like cupin family protein
VTGITTTKRYRLKQLAPADFPLRVTDPAATQNHVPHSHDFVEVVLVTGGSGVHTAGGAETPVSAGDLIIIPKGLKHGYRSVKDFKIVNVIFDLSLLSLPRADLRHIPGFHSLFLLPHNNRAKKPRCEFTSLAPEEAAFAAGLVRKMQNELKTRAPGFKAVCLGALLELTVFLSRREFRKTPADSTGGLDKVLAHMERGHNKKLSVKELAAIAGRSERSFHRVFRTVTGQSPAECLLGIRLRRAKSLLLETSMSVTEIASETGFTDGAYFAKQFKRLFGVTPRESRALSAGRRTL